MFAALFHILCIHSVPSAGYRCWPRVWLFLSLKAHAAPCWLLEDFVVATECSQCNAFQTRSWSACEATGYVERVNCTRSNRDEYKSCRSAVLEEHLFWKFEAAMLALTASFAILVVIRQRSLDRLASEKVRRQIESI
uniref:Protein JTB n=1 Tax=Labrus bergylta TaxID=56723 RepID=A0A3Q3GER0_9LABR